MDLQPRIGTTGLGQGSLDFSLLADEVQFGDVWVSLQGQLDPIDDDSDSVVATHDIHDDSHKWKERSELPPDRALESYAPAVTVMTWRPL